MIKEMLTRLFGLRSKRFIPSASMRHPMDPGELRGLAARSLVTFGTEAEFCEPRPKLTGITTDDLNKETMEVFPDYLARRAARAAAGKDEPRAFGVVNHDVHPD